MILVTDLSIPLRLGITAEVRYSDLVWVAAGAGGIGMVMASTGTVTVVGRVVAPGMAAGISLTDTTVADIMAAGTTSRFAAGEMLRHRKRSVAAPSRAGRIDRLPVPPYDREAKASRLTVPVPLLIKNESPGKRRKPAGFQRRKECP
jgi:hypothetical protein